MSIALERPIQDFADDLLDRSTFIERLGRTLVSPDGKLSSGVVLGICGEWGSGKSSLLNLLAHHLREQQKAVVVQFDPWLISGRDDLVNRLLQQLASELSDRSLGEKARSVGEKLFEYVEALSPVADAAVKAADMVVPGAGTVTKFAASKARAKLTRPADLHSRRRRLEEALDKVERPIVVMIDELDRLEDSEIRAMAQLVRSVADFSQISYVLAYDPKRVAEALGADAGAEPEARLGRGTSYLEKIVQYQIPLPVPSKGELLQMADQVIGGIAGERKNLGKWHELPDCGALLRILVPGVLRTPRDIKRWAGLFNAQEPMFYGEVDWVDLLAFSALMAKAPRTVEYMRRMPQCVGIPASNDYEQEYFLEYVRNREKSAAERREMKLSRLCPEGERTASVDSLLGFIFPELADSYSKRQNDGPDRLCRPRPFQTVLRYGIPPGHFSRTDIISFLNADFEERKKKFDLAIKNKMGISFVTRFGEVYLEGVDVDHVALWADIANIQRKSDEVWIAMVPDREISDEFARVLSRRAVKDLLPVVQEIVSELRHLKDREILPCVIHSHIWGHGLFGAEQRHAQDNWLSAPLVEEVAHEIGADFAERFLVSPRVLASTWHMYPYYIASRAGHWSDDCRKAATTALADNGFLDTLVIMMFGKNYKTPRQAIDGMLDFSAFMVSAEVRMGAQDFDRQDISLQAAYASLMDRIPYE